MKIHTVRLSAEGKEEFGHIFKADVPVQEYTPKNANLDGLDEEQRVYLVDWVSLSSEQQQQVLTYMHKRFGESEQVIRQRIEKDTYFSIRCKWVIEAYDMRFLM